MLIGTEKTIPSKHYLDCRSVSKKIAAELKPLYFEESIILQQHIFPKIIYSFGCCCCSVASDSLQPHRLHQARFLCPSPSPGACSNSCPLSRWCHPTIPSSVITYSCCPQSFSASGSFPRSQFFASGGQSIGLSVSASVLPMNIQGWFPLGRTGLISLQPKGLSRISSNITVQKHQFFGTQLSLWSNSYIHTWLLEKSWLWLDGPLSTKKCFCFLICCLDLS